MNKSETVTIRLSKEYKTKLVNIGSEHKVKPGTYAAAAVEAWLDACEKAGGYIIPQYKNAPISEPLVDALSTVIEAWSRTSTAEKLEIEASPDGERLTLKRRAVEPPLLKIAETPTKTYGSAEDSRKKAAG